MALPRVLHGATFLEAREEASHWLAQVGLTPRSQHKPHQVSGGEMQRAAIARALINRPAVLLADEPTGNLDSATASQILELFARVHRNWRQTVVLVSHAAEVAVYADRILSMQDGVIL